MGLKADLEDDVDSKDPYGFYADLTSGGLPLGTRQKSGPTLTKALGNVGGTAMLSHATVQHMTDNTHVKIKK